MVCEFGQNQQTSADSQFPFDATCHYCIFHSNKSKVRQRFFFSFLFSLSSSLMSSSFVRSSSTHFHPKDKCKFQFGSRIVCVRLSPRTLSNWLNDKLLKFLSIELPFTAIYICWRHDNDSFFFYFRNSIRFDDMAVCCCWCVVVHPRHRQFDTFFFLIYSLWLIIIINIYVRYCCRMLSLLTFWLGAHSAIPSNSKWFIYFRMATTAMQDATTRRTDEREMEGGNIQSRIRNTRNADTLYIGRWWNEGPFSVRKLTKSGQWENSRSEAPISLAAQFPYPSSIDMIHHIQTESN